MIFREIQTLGYEGGISRLRAYMREQKPEAREERIIRFETEPGQQMQVDWAEFRQGKDRLSAFIATLGFSRASYVKFVTDEKLHTLLTCHESAFRYFGGVPYEILYDNMKTVIIGRNYYGQGKHRLQSGFWDFSKHYGFIPRVCRPYRAQTKGKVERFIHYLRYSFYRPLLGELKHKGETLDVVSANEHVLYWLNAVANKRIHGTTGQQPFALLHEEQKHLQNIARPYSRLNLDAIDVDVPKAVNILQHSLEVYDQLFLGEV